MKLTNRLSIALCVVGISGCSEAPTATPSVSEFDQLVEKAEGQNEAKFAHYEKLLDCYVSASITTPLVKFDTEEERAIRDKAIAGLAAKLKNAAAAARVNDTAYRFDDKISTFGSQLAGATAAGKRALISRHMNNAVQCVDTEL